MFIDITFLNPFEVSFYTPYKRDWGTGEVHGEVVIIKDHFRNGDCFKLFNCFNFFCEGGYINGGIEQEGFYCLVNHATFNEGFIALNINYYVSIGDKFSHNGNTICASIYILWSDVNLCAKIFCDLRYFFIINSNDDFLEELRLFGIFPGMPEHWLTAYISEGFTHESCRAKTRRDYANNHLCSAYNFGNFEELIIFIGSIL